jgi:hypothetical protein
MSRRFKEYDDVLLLELHEGPGNYSQGEVHAVPAGAEGTIIDVLSQGKAFEVEFMLAKPQINGNVVIDSGTWHIITLTPDQIIPA